MKRCWLARYWGLAVQHGNQLDIIFSCLRGKMVACFELHVFVCRGISRWCCIKPVSLLHMLVQFDGFLNFLSTLDSNHTRPFLNLSLLVDCGCHHSIAHIFDMY